MIGRLTIIGGLLIACGASVIAQRIEAIDEATLPRFEVASVRLGNPNATSARIGTPPGRFVQEDMDMFSALNMAFGVRPYQMPNPLPDVLRGRYSIDAKMPAGAPQKDVGLMVRALLIDRFKLRYHVETKEQDGYALTLRRDGRLGPGIRQSTADCGARIAAQRRNETLQPMPAGSKECGIRNGPGTIDFGGMPLSLLMQMLSNQTGQQVVDRTGLTGPFDVELHWSSSSGPLRASPDSGQAGDNGPSIFTAVEEQLGLKLEPTKAPVDYLVIDHVERPEPD